MGKIAKALSNIVGVLIIIVTFIPELVSSFELFWRLLVVFIGVGLIVIPYVWKYAYYKTGYWIVRYRRRVIGLALDVAENDKIVNFCNEETARLGLSSKIIFKPFRTDNISQKKLSQKIAKSRMDVVVCKQRPLHNGKVPLRFIYKDRTDHLIARIVHTEVSSMIAREAAFNIKNETLLVDLNLEKINIANLSLNIVANCTTLFRGIDKGIWVFEKLHARLRGQPGVIAENTAKRLRELYLIKGHDLLKKNKYNESISILEKAYEIDSRGPDLLASLALAYFMVGNEKSSEERSQELLQNYCGNPFSHLDAAFFRIRRHRYVRALRQYRCYKNTKPHASITLDAITFFSNLLDRQPGELGYLFARAYLKNLITNGNQQIGESSAREDFQAFLRRAIDEEYAVLVEVAKKMV